MTEEKRRRGKSSVFPPVVILAEVGLQPRPWMLRKPPVPTNRTSAEATRPVMWTIAHAVMLAFSIWIGFDVPSSRGFAASAFAVVNSVTAISAASSSGLANRLACEGAWDERQCG